MIEEAYCSFETAKLLKEKGFNEYCFMHYEEDGSQYISDEEPGDCISAPTHQMAMRWLRETHNKHCDVGYDIDLRWFFQIIDLEGHVEYDYHETKYYHAENESGFNSYEDAVEAALKYALENIITKEDKQ